MNTQKINALDLVNNIASTLNASQMATPLRQLEIGYDLYKDPYLKEYRGCTVGGFLAKAERLNRIPKKINNIIQAIGYWATCGSGIAIADLYNRAKEVECSILQNVTEKKVLPSDSERPFIEQAFEVFDTLISAMTTLSECNARIGERLSLSFRKGLSDREIGVLTHSTHECVRLARTEIQSNIIKGKVFKELSEEFKISDLFCQEAQDFVSEIENHTIDSLIGKYQGLSEANLRFIIQALGLSTIVIGGREYMITHGKSGDYRRAADNIRKQLRREFDYTSIETLTCNLDNKTKAFAVAFLESQPGIYQFSEDRTCVRMVGAGLQKVIRVARIIFDSGRLISNEEIDEIYYTYYMSQAPINQSPRLRELGFHCQNKSGKWQFGEPMPKLQDIIRNIITPQRPIATLKSIISAAENAGLDYPVSTIRAYVTDIATPENKQNDLFCLKGYGHYFPNYSWRKYSKAA